MRRNAPFLVDSFNYGYGSNRFILTLRGFSRRPRRPQEIERKGHAPRARQTDRYVTEDAVMVSEIEQLPNLTGFLKLASLPEWRRVVLELV